jgi:hypothetical protein
MREWSGASCRMIDFDEQSEGSRHDSLLFLHQWREVAGQDRNYIYFFLNFMLCLFYSAFFIVY